MKFFTRLTVAGVLLCISLCSTGQTNPTAQNLPYSFTSLGEATLPAGMAAHRFGTTAGAIPTTRTLSPANGDLPSAGGASGGWSFHNANGISMLASGGQAAGAIVVSIVTTGLTNVEVNWKAGTFTQQASRDNSLALQYRVGTTGNWTDVGTTSTYVTTGNPNGHISPLFTEVLPVAAENQPVVQVRWIYWESSGTSGSRDRINIDTISISGTTATPICTAPSTQASAITFDNVTSSTLDLNWTNGNGDGRIVLINTSNSFTAPSNGSNPTANTTYAGTGEQVVYNGTGSGPISISGLDPATEYWFQVYEFCSPDRVYQTSAGTNNPNSEETLPASAETITTTATSFGPFCYGIANNLSVAYTTTGTFTGIFTAQLSDANGSFASPTIIGTGASPIAATIPGTVAAGNGYRVRVINDNPATVGSNNGSNIIIETVTVNLGADTSYCANVAFNHTLNAGNAGSTFLWNNSSTLQTLNITQAGTYSVTVTSANGCEGTDEIVVTENQAPVVDLGADESFCADEDVSVTLEAGNVGSTYLWSNGMISQDITAEAFGTFWVAVTNANGCVGTDTMKIHSLALPIINLGNDTSYCEGSNFSLVLDAGNPGSLYLWEDFSETQTITVTEAGFYAVIVEDLNGCLQYAEITITENPLPVVNLGNDTSYCAGTSFSIILNAGNPGSTYLWNGSGTSQLFSVTQAGTYSVVVTDANGCVGTDSKTITENTLPVVDLGNDTSYCAGSTFSLVLDAGNPGLTFNWNNGEASTQTFTATGDGTYSVTVTDANGCTGTDSRIISEDALPVINLGNDITTAGASQVLDAGTGFASYSWTPGNQTTQQITVNQNGTYKVTVTNADGCSASDEVNVWFTASIDETGSVIALQMFPNPANHVLNIRMDYQGDVRLDILSSNGQRLANRQVAAYEAGQTIEMDLGQFSSGLYILRLSGKGISVSKQFIINK